MQGNGQRCSEPTAITLSIVVLPTCASLQRKAPCRCIAEAVSSMHTALSGRTVVHHCDHQPHRRDSHHTCWPHSAHLHSSRAQCSGGWRASTRRCMQSDRISAFDESFLDNSRRKNLFDQNSAQTYFIDKQRELLSICERVGGVMRSKPTILQPRVCMLMGRDQIIQMIISKIYHIFQIEWQASPPACAGAFAKNAHLWAPPHWKQAM